MSCHGYPELLTEDRDREPGGSDTRYKALLGYATHLLDVAQAMIVLFNKQEPLPSVWLPMVGEQRGVEKRRLKDVSS